MKSPLILRIFKNGQLVGVKQFDQDQIVIGHNGEVHLDLDSDQVSTIHCLIEARDDDYYVCDLGSSSGTFKNGQAVLDELITSGDEVQIGPFKIAFFIGVPKKTVIGPFPSETVITSKPVEQPAAVPTPSVPSQPVVPAEKTVSSTPVDATQVITNPVVVTPAPQVVPSDSEAPIPVAVKTAVIPAAPVAPVAPVTPVTPVTQVVPVAPVAPVIPVEVPKAEEKPVIAKAPTRPEIRPERVSYKKVKKTKTYAPPSEIKDLKSYLKPGKGNTVEVVVAWKERVLTTYHFRGSKTVRVNYGEDQVSLPNGLVQRGHPILEMAGELKINTTTEMQVDIVSSSGAKPIEDLTANGKALKTGLGYSVRLDQGEMLCINFTNGNISLYIRYVPQPPVVPLIPVALTGTEITAVVMSVVMVALFALYISATTPKDWQEPKQEEVQRIAQVVFNKPPVPAKPKPQPPPPPPPEPVKTPPPPPQPQKVVVADQNREAQKKGPKVDKAEKAQTAARASEVAPKPAAKDRTKKFTSTRQGGAIKTGNTAGANAASSNKDLSKVGLFSAFGGGGSRANIDKAYSGSGEVLGMADRATGTSGFNEDRAGDDLGSKFKDSGAGGKGTATQGIAGIGTKGRGSGQSAYGASDGFGSKSSVAIEGGGFEESFDGTIDKEAIRRVIRAKLHEVKSCYERALNTMEKGQKLEGKIVLSWDIVEKGQARNVKVKSSSLGNPKVENCIRDRLASWTFPEPPPGLVAEVQAYPFVLNQSN